MRRIFTTLIAALAVFSTTARAETADRNFGCSVYNERGALVICERIVSETSRGEIGADKVAALRHELEEHGLEMPSAAHLAALANGSAEVISHKSSYPRTSRILPWPKNITQVAEISRDLSGGFIVRSGNPETATNGLLLFIMLSIVTATVAQGIACGIAGKWRLAAPTGIVVGIIAGSAAGAAIGPFGGLLGALAGSVAGFAFVADPEPVLGVWDAFAGGFAGLVAGTFFGLVTEGELPISVWGEWIAFCGIVILLRLAVAGITALARRRLVFWRPV